jgi:DNA-binding NtrC family response regulator
MNILIVDDEQLVRWFLERALLRWGHRVVSVSSTRDALDALGKEDFDLVFTDLRMPEENGQTLIDSMSPMTGRKPKIIVCSAYITADLADNFRVKGISILRKPFKLEELEQVLSETTVS